MSTLFFTYLYLLTQDELGTVPSRTDVLGGRPSTESLVEIVHFHLGWVTETRSRCPSRLFRRDWKPKITEPLSTPPWVVSILLDSPRERISGSVSRNLR